MREYNAQLHREFKNANFDDKYALDDEHSEDMDDDLDNKSDDDDFLDELKKKSKEKHVNMDKLTRRQRMTHLAKQNLN